MEKGKRQIFCVVLDLPLSLPYSVFSLAQVRHFLFRSVFIGLQMADLSKRENGVWGNEIGDPAISELTLLLRRAFSFQKSSTISQ